MGYRTSPVAIVVLATLAVTRSASALTRQVEGRSLQAVVTLDDNTAAATQIYFSSSYLVGQASYVGFVVTAPAAPKVYSHSTLQVAMYRSQAGPTRPFTIDLRCLSAPGTAGLPGTLLGTVTSSVTLTGTAPSAASYVSHAISGLPNIDGVSACPFYMYVLSSNYNFDSNWVYSTAAGPVPTGTLVANATVLTATAANGPWNVSAAGYPSVYLVGADVSPSPSATAVSDCSARVRHAAPRGALV
jgi:hypothetical protein